MAGEKYSYHWTLKGKVKSTYDSLYYCRGTSTRLCQCLHDIARHKTIVSLACFSTPLTMKQYLSLHVFEKFGKEYLCMKIAEREEGGGGGGAGGRGRGG